MISIIVPVFNVALYLEKCLASLALLKFQDVEIIIIDDGSTDGGGQIADNYCQKSRFKCIHTSNRGLSAARNRGLDEAKGEWLMFVDGDDWVDRDFCKIPYEQAIKYNADMVIFQARANKNKAIKELSSKGTISHEMAVKYGDSYVWNKLYKRKLFDGIRFPEGKVYEDLAITHKVIYAADKILMLPNVLCHHVYRRDSISRLKSVRNKREGYIFALKRANDLKAYGCDKSIYMPVLVSYALGMLAVSFPSDDSVFKSAEKTIDSVHYVPDELSIEKKLMLLTWKFDRRLFHLICRLLGKKANGLSRV